jgi:uncharacterized protein (DUF58 family)
MQFSKWVTLGFGALCLVAVAGVLGAQHLYYMAAILLTLPGVSYGLGWFSLRGLKFSRELPLTAWEGEEGEIIYAVENSTRAPRFFLSIQEPLPRWIQMREVETPLFNVHPNDTTRIAHRVRYRKRGVYKVESFDVTAMDPLGVFAFTAHIPAAGELVVYPTPRQMRALQLTGAERYGWQEFTAIALRGSSVDPDGVRLYAPGDPLRRIHWRQTARTNKLSVIEFEETQSIHLVIALDTQRGSEVGSGTETTLEYAVRFVASAAFEAIQQGANVRLVLSESNSEEPEQYLPLSALSGRGEEHLFAILDTLARVEANSAQSVGAMVQSALGSLSQGTTFCVVTSRPDPGLADALMYCASYGVNVSVVYIDASSFDGGRVSAADSQRFLEALMAVRAQPFLLRHNSDGELYPEAIGYASVRA